MSDACHLLCSYTGSKLFSAATGTRLVINEPSHTKTSLKISCFHEHCTGSAYLQTMPSVENSYSIILIACIYSSIGQNMKISNHYFSYF